MTMCTRLIEQARKLESVQNALTACLQCVDTSLSETKRELEQKRNEERERQDVFTDNPYLSAPEYERLAGYFKDRGFVITDLAPVDEVTKNKYRLAKNIVDRFRVYETVFKPLLAFLYQAEESTFRIDAMEGADKTAVWNFCLQLQRMEWLVCSKDKKSTCITVERWMIPPQERSFFNGSWAEDAARYRVDKALRASGIKSRGTFRQVKVRECCTPTGGTPAKQRELDLIVDLGDRFYFFETKSGKTLGIERWVDNARDFAEPNGPNRYFMCCADTGIDMRLFRPYRLFHLENLDTEFQQFLESEKAQQPFPD